MNIQKNEGKYELTQLRHQNESKTKILVVAYKKIKNKNSYITLNFRRNFNFTL